MDYILLNFPTVCYTIYLELYSNVNNTGDVLL